MKDIIKQHIVKLKEELKQLEAQVDLDRSWYAKNVQKVNDMKKLIAKMES